MRWMLSMVIAAASFSCGSGDNGPDGCTAPEPLIAGTAKTNAIADSPARCGQQSYQWLRDGVGQVVSTGEPGRTTREVIEALVNAQGLALPSPPAYAAVLTDYTYTTQGRGELVEATALFACPEDRDAPQGAGTLLFLHGTLGLEDGCSASNDIGTRLLAALGASLGYDVIVPDLIGLKASGDPTGFLHPYLIGEPTALASLDAVRAAMRLDPASRLERCVCPELLIIGASQGGHAGLFVERYVHVYARELSVQGVAVAVSPASLYAQFLHKAQDDQAENGFLLSGVTAMADWYGVSGGLPLSYLECEGASHAEASAWAMSGPAVPGGPGGRATHGCPMHPRGGGHTLLRYDVAWFEAVMI